MDVQMLCSEIDVYDKFLHLLHGSIVTNITVIATMNTHTIHNNNGLKGIKEIFFVPQIWPWPKHTNRQMRKKNIFKKITYTHSHTFVFKNVGFFVFHEKYLQRLTSINKQVEINSWTQCIEMEWQGNKISYTYIVFQMAIKWHTEDLTK